MRCRLPPTRADIPWDDQALMEQFRYGLRNDVKDLLLTFPEEPKSLTEVLRDKLNIGRIG